MQRNIILYVIAKMSVRPYVGLKKFLVFIFLSVCHARTRRSNNPIRLKLGTDFYGLCKISCIVFGAHCPKSAGTEIRRLHGPDFSGLDPAWAKLKIKISAQAWPGPKEKS